MSSKRAQRSKQACAHTCSLHRGCWQATAKRASFFVSFMTHARLPKEGNNHRGYHYLPAACSGTEYCVSWATGVCILGNCCACAALCGILLCIAAYCPTPPRIASYCQRRACIALHCLVLPCSALHCLVLPRSALHCLVLHCSALHCIVVPRFASVCLIIANARALCVKVPLAVDHMASNKGRVALHIISCAALHIVTTTCCGSLCLPHSTRHGTR